MFFSVAATWVVAGFYFKVSAIQKDTEAIKAGIQIINELSKEVGEAKAQADAAKAMVSGQNEELAMMATWILTTRISLAEQGFKTPQFNYPPKGD